MTGGIQARDTYEELSQQSILFVSRLRSDSRYKVLEQRPLESSTESHLELVIEKDYQVELYNRKRQATQSFLRLVIARKTVTDETFLFITSIDELSAYEITQLYKQRWEIEVFFKFLKQELNLNHMISRSLNGIKVVLYLTLILAILLTVYKKLNQLKGYKIPRLKFAQELEANIIEQIVILCGGDPAKIPK